MRLLNTLSLLLLRIKKRIIRNKMYLLVFQAWNLVNQVFSYLSFRIRDEKSFMSNK
jgi:hypothetical protein